jgi:hypothetical protein
VVQDLPSGCRPFRLPVPHEQVHAPFPPPPHRTGRADLPHPALRRVSPAGPRTRPSRTGPSPAWIAPSATSEPKTGLVDLAVNPQALGHLHSVPEVRSLPSTGITQLRRYYGPLRHPRKPGLSLAGVRLPVTRWHLRGLPVLRTFPCADMPSPLPRRDRWWDRVAPL